MSCTIRLRWLPYRRTRARRGHLDEADDWYRKSLTIAEELGDRPGMAGTYHQRLGITTYLHGDMSVPGGLAWP